MSKTNIIYKMPKWSLHATRIHSAQHHIPNMSSVTINRRADVRNYILLIQTAVRQHSRGPSIVPIALYSACEIAWIRWEQPVVKVCLVVPIVAIAPVSSAGTHRHHTLEGPLRSKRPSIVPVALYSACEIAWHRWEQSVVAVCRAVPVAAIVPVYFPLKCTHTGTIL